jgi:large conductance mechanosensitive channel
MIKGFGQFVVRGNVIDLAVAVVMGAAFTAVVTAFVKDLIGPLIAAIFGKPNFAAMGFTIHNSRFLIGDFINAVIAFLIVSVVVYFFIVAPMNAVMARFKTAEPAMKACPECTSEIPAAAVRCKYCTAVVPGES